LDSSWRMGTGLRKTTCYVLFFYMDINIRRNVGVLFCILAPEHPVNPVVLAAVLSSAFITEIYKSVFLPYTHIEVARTGHTYECAWHRHCDFFTCVERLWTKCILQ